MKNVLTETEFTKIRTLISQTAISDKGKAALLARRPATQINTVRSWLKETEEAMTILASGQHIPLMGLVQIGHLTQKITKGQILEPSELTEYSDFLRSFQLIQKLFQKNAYQVPTLFAYSQQLGDFSEITKEITGMVNGTRLNSDSSRQLRKARNQVQKIEGEIEAALQKYLRNGTTQKYLQERLILKKGDRYTLPVKAEFQNKINGAIIEKSNKGTTVFVEPSNVARLNEKLILAQAEEVAEVYQLLAYLTGLLAAAQEKIGYSLETVVELDIIFARAKYSRSIDGVKMAVNDEEILHLSNVTHPLLGDKAVPLSVSLGTDARGLIITGPNAGGKTVVLKTLALTCLLTAFGVLVHHDGTSNIAIFNEILIDIGDQQDMENALSTFSGHMQNIAKILRHSKRNTLVLLDEIGSGTEPNEGAALGIAIMEQMYQNGALVVATTHYGEIKDFALAHEDFKTAAMAFDAQTLTPKYQLLMNEVGSSNAFWIAEKMQLQKDVIDRSRQLLKQKDYAGKKRAFKKVSQVQTTRATLPQFQKGDRVFSSATNKTALFYEAEGEEGIVYAEDKFFKVPLRRLRLEMAAEKLYPLDYDVESLFQDFHEEKFKKDLVRGSKKAHKQLRKMEKARRDAGRDTSN
ncbi:endonuclease MutS2 [Enterococcus sp.]|uniref:endonuclease MutS2 n=1 Tax=Enterococcus sp. TaxID=35783 RepID=UPI002FC77B75